MRNSPPATALPALRLAEDWRALFRALSGAGYAWEPRAPDHIRRLRQAPAGLDVLARAFGLGLRVADAELVEAGIPAELLPRLRELAPAVSGAEGAFVVHDHGGLAAAGGRGGFVYLGPESFALARLLGERAALLRGRRVLDLGSGAGALSFAVARLGAAEVRGIECSARAVEWAGAAAVAQGIPDVRFAHGQIGGAADGGAPAVSAEGAWQVAVFNPPMAVTAENSSRPERDGGPTGVELPLRFVNFAGRWLDGGGDALFLATNPLVAGRPVFFDRLRAERGEIWDIVDRKRLHDSFNQSLHQQDGYGRRGIDRIELWFVHLRKR